MSKYCVYIYLLLFSFCKETSRVESHATVFNSLEIAKKEARQTKKHILIFFDALSSNHSSEFQQIYEDSLFLTYRNNFINTFIYVDDRTITSTGERIGKENLMVLKSLDPDTKWPCVMILDSSGNLISDIIYVAKPSSKENLINAMKNFLD